MSLKTPNIGTLQEEINMAENQKRTIEETINEAFHQALQCNSSEGEGSIILAFALIIANIHHDGGYSIEEFSTLLSNFTQEEQEEILKQLPQRFLSHLSSYEESYSNILRIVFAIHHCASIDILSEENLDFSNYFLNANRDRIRFCKLLFEDSDSLDLERMLEYVSILDK